MIHNYIDFGRSSNPLEKPNTFLNSQRPGDYADIVFSGRCKTWGTPIGAPIGCFILPLFQNFHSLRWESLTIHTRSTLIFFGRFWGPPSSPIRPGSYFRPGPPDLWRQNHINDHKTPLNCQNDSSNTSNSMFFCDRGIEL